MRRKRGEMASDHSDAIQVKPEELYDPNVGGLPGASAVHIKDVEEVHPSDGQKIDDPNAQVQQTSDADDQSATTTHETPEVKTTYNTQDDPSKTSKIKAKLMNLGDKLRPKEAVDAKQADPHPSLQ